MGKYGNGRQHAPQGFPHRREVRGSQRGAQGSIIDRSPRHPAIAIVVKLRESHPSIAVTREGSDALTARASNDALITSAHLAGRIHRWFKLHRSLCREMESIEVATDSANPPMVVVRGSLRCFRAMLQAQAKELRDLRIFRENDTSEAHTEGMHREERA